MNDNAFLAELPAPDAGSIAAALGGAHPWYQGILEAAEGFEAEWKHYGRKYGWKLKIHDGAKALLELSIGKDGFRVALAAREREMLALREDPLTAPILAEYMDEKKAKEGWGIRIDIDGETRYKQALVLLRVLAALRKGGPAAD